jgi:hypothetical protein
MASVPAASRRTSSTSHAACMSCRVGAGQYAARRSRPHGPRAPLRRRGGRAGPRTAWSTASTAERPASRLSCSSSSMPCVPRPRLTTTRQGAACETAGRCLHLCGVPEQQRRQGVEHQQGCARGTSSGGRALARACRHGARNSFGRLGACACRPTGARARVAGQCLEQSSPARQAHTFVCGAAVHQSQLGLRGLATRLAAPTKRGPQDVLGLRPPLPHGRCELPHHLHARHLVLEAGTGLLGSCCRLHSSNSQAAASEPRCRRQDAPAAGRASPTTAALRTEARSSSMTYSEVVAPDEPSRRLLTKQSIPSSGGRP